MTSNKIKIGIFPAFFVIMAINAITFVAIYRTIHSAASVAESTVERARKLNTILGALSKLDLAASDLNAPGNDVFESQDVGFEEKRFNNYKNNFQEEISDLRKQISKLISVDEQKIIYQRLDAIQSHSELFTKVTAEIFSSFQKKSYSEASKKMAQMDRSYSDFRKAIIEMRTKLRSIDDKIGEELQSVTHDQNSKTILILIVNLVFNVVLVALAILAYKKSKSNERVLKFYKFALDHSAIVATTDKNGKITFANQKFSEVSGYHKDELIGQDHRLLNSHFHPKGFFEDLWRTINSGNVWHGEIRNKRKDGSFYWVDSTITPMNDDSGAVSEYVAIRFDITQRKEYESMIEKREKELDQFFNLSQDFLCIASMHGPFKKISHSFERILGYSMNEIRSVSFINFVHPEDIALTLEELKKMSKGTAVFSITNRWRKKNGDYIYVSWMVTPTTEGIFYAIGRDVTELKAMTEKIEAATKVKSSFLANMSHEIRTPLNGILGMTTLLSNEKLSNEGLRHLEIMKSSGDTLLALINDILDFSKIEAGKLSLEKVSFCIEDTIQELVSLLYFKAKEKNLTIQIDIDKTLPRYVSSDVTRFRQVLTNLLGNAIKFTQKGSVTVTASGNTDSNGIYLIRLDVIDTGPGMSQDAQNALFKSFSQVDASTTRKFGGTGLGLAICKGICEAMGGNIWVESQSGIGSTFSFTFKAEKTDAPPASRQELIETYDAKLSQRHPYRILVADDHATNQLLAKKFFEKLGYEPDFVGNGLEVLNALKLKSYDVIFMDGHMPEMDGYETTKKIRSRFEDKDSPWIVAFTASASKEDQKNCYDCGMNDFVSKPFTISALAQALMRVHGGSPEHDERESAPTARLDTSTDFNVSALLAHFAGDEDILREMIHTFLSSLPRLVENIENAIKSKNAHDVMVAAHTLKGTTSNFFVATLQKSLQELENAGKNKQLNESDKKLDLIKLQLSSLSSNLESMLTKKKVA